MYKTELHIHTRESSRYSKISAKNILKVYKKNKYSTIVTTDHLYSKDMGEYKKSNIKKWRRQIDKVCFGNEKMKLLNEKLGYGLNILFSIELTLKETDSDYLVYGITKEFLYDNEKIYDLTLKQLHKLCKDNNFLLIQAHPFRDNIKRAEFEDVDGYEGYNGCKDEESRNFKALNYGINSGKLITSGSDAHRKYDTCSGGIQTKDEIKSIEELIHVLRYENIIHIKDGN